MTNTSTHASTTASRRFQCRHIFADGHRCGSPCLRGEELCYFHHTTRRPIVDLHARRSRQSRFDLPLPEDRSSIQSSIGEVLRRLSRNEIDPRRAGLLLYGLQIASSNLPRTLAAKPAAQPAEVVDEIVLHPTLGPLAPTAEVGASSVASARSSLMARFLEELGRGREALQSQSPAAPHPSPDPAPEPSPTPSSIDLQACAAEPLSEPSPVPISTHPVRTLHPWTSSSFVAATPSSAPSRSPEPKTPLSPAWPPPSSPKTRSSSKTSPRSATSRPSANCSRPWAPRSSSATAAPSTAPTSAAPSCRTPVAKYEIVKTMRASSLVLGPLIARTGVARVAMPGGCAIGGRPIDLHIKGLESMGATISQEHGYLEARAPGNGDGRLRGAHIVFDKITVTGTEDLLMAATLAEGETLFENCAREPEVTDLAALLNAMGARISGAGTSTIRVTGVEKLHGAPPPHQPRPHRGRNLSARRRHHRRRPQRRWLQPRPPRRPPPQARAVRRSGSTSARSASASASGGALRAADISTEEYPGFPTDMQAQFMALATQTDGTTTVTENLFENRFMHVQELNRMGANITVNGRTATIRGKSDLQSAAVMCSDLRASASLVLAALVADGETILDRVYHLDRGYERFEEKLRNVGAQIRRMGDVLQQKVAAAP